MNLFCLLLAAIAAPFTLSFEDAAVPGVQGQAAFFDGFDSRVVVPASQVPTPERHFTVDVWACPLAFPKSPCPLACRIGGSAPFPDWADAAAGGWALWLDATGRVHFQVASAGEWVEVVSPKALPLRAWSRVTCQFRAGSGLYLAVDGREVAKAVCELPWVNQAEFPLWLGRAPFRTPSFFENQHIPIYSSFDGALDELKIDTDKQAYAKILKEKFVRPSAPGSEVPGFGPRRLPSGPERLAFGAWYIPLRYYPSYDARW
ncbi:MAG: LamG domain-containing protein, partial [Bacteroidales bacterium]|nr:LamG domain-containing protein [Bacteroidales bacterium]